MIRLSAVLHLSHGRRRARGGAGCSLLFVARSADLICFSHLFVSSLALQEVEMDLKTEDASMALPAGGSSMKQFKYHLCQINIETVFTMILK